jgi:hypothetical protein
VPAEAADALVTAETADAYDSEEEREGWRLKTPQLSVSQPNPA